MSMQGDYDTINFIADDTTDMGRDNCFSMNVCIEGIVRIWSGKGSSALAATLT